MFFIVIFHCVATLTFAPVALHCIVRWRVLVFLALYCTIVLQRRGLESGYWDRSHNRLYRPVSIWPLDYLSGETNLSSWSEKNTDFNLLLAAEWPI